MEKLLAGSNLIVSLMVAHLIASLAAVEIRHLKSAILALVVQSSLLAAIFAAFGYLTGHESLYLWALVCVGTKVVLIPILLWKYSARLPQRELRPMLSFPVSVVLVGMAVVFVYRFMHAHVEFVAPTAEAAVEPVRSSLAIAFTVIALGLYVMTVRRDAVKLVMGLILMENGVHLTLVGLAPTLPETALLGVTTNVVILAWLMLYLTDGVYRLLGTTDVTELSRLKR
jgi:hydrogenase-4 component E